MKKLFALGSLVIAALGLSSSFSFAQTRIMSTVAGNYAFSGISYSGDGASATAAKVSNPYGVFVDGSGNTFIADHGYSVIREVDHSTGIIFTVAGNGFAGSGFSGDGAAATAAQLHQPTGVYVDGSGNIFIADNRNNVIRKVDNSTGNISTI